MKTKDFSFVNIVPVKATCPEFAVSEIRRQHKEVGLTKFALMLTLQPMGFPAKDNADRIISTAAKVMEELKDEPLTIGILFQSFLGHGWSGRVPLTDEPWQRIVKNDGVLSSRMCTSDENFQKYILYVVEEVMKLGPKFLITDDDFGLRRGECFCQNHVNMFNAAAKEKFGSLPRSAKELIQMVESRPEDDPEVVLLAEIRHKELINIAREIRKVIDKYDDTVSCTQCTSGGAHGWINELVHTLAGKKAMPSVRVNNAIYCINQPLDMYRLTSQTYKIKNCYDENVPEILDEADTCPQTYYAENSILFHTHLTNAALCGLTGAKIWISEFENSYCTRYYDKFEYYLKNYRGFYNELRNTVDKTTYQGIHHLLVKGDYPSMTHPLNASWPSYSSDWNMGLMGTFAFPLAYDRGENDGIYALCETSVRFATDEQLKELFRKNLLIDSKAAKLLSARGFDKYIGVKTVEDSRFFFTHELDEEENRTMGLMWEPDMAKLECISDKTEIKTWCVQDVLYDVAPTKQSPCMTFFTNELGGRVATLAWTYDFTLLKIWGRHRRDMLMKAVQFLNGGVQVDMLLDVWQQVLVRHGKIGDGAEELVALISLSLDKIPEIKLSMSRPVYGVKQLQADGSWADVKFECDCRTLKVDLPLEIASPVILKLKVK